MEKVYLKHGAEDVTSRKLDTHAEYTLISNGRTHSVISNGYKNIVIKNEYIKKPRS